MSTNKNSKESNIVAFIIMVICVLGICICIKGFMGKSRETTKNEYYGR